MMSARPSCFPTPSQVAVERAGSAMGDAKGHAEAVKALLAAGANKDAALPVG